MRGDCDIPHRIREKVVLKSNYDIFIRLEADH